MIQYGDADAVVCGGAEATLTEFAFALASTRCRRCRRPAISRPFDAAPRRVRDGRGRRRPGARGGRGGRRRAAPRSSARWSATARPRTPYHLTAPEPTGGPAVAGDRARAAPTPAPTPAEVDYVNAHGTSTQLNDAAETGALKQALGERRQAHPDLLDQVGDRAPARCRRRGRGGGHRAHAAHAA